MRAKEYLRQARYLNIEINSKIREKEQCIHLLTASPVLQPDMVSSSKKTQPDERFAQIAQLGKEIDEDIDRLYTLKKDISTKIDMMNDALARSVIRDYYLNYMSWEAIAEEYNQSLRNVHYLHKRALEEFENLLH